MIYIDISAAVHRRAGLGRYSHQLAKSLIEAEPEAYGLFYNGAPQDSLPSALESAPTKTVRWGYKAWRAAVLAANKTNLNFNSLVPDAQLFHSTEHLLMPLTVCPTVLTVHDLIFEHYPEYHKRLNYTYLKMAMPLFCKKATAIIAVSEATKKDIIGFYGISPGKIHVVYEAAAGHFEPQEDSEIERVRATYRLPERYLIQLGTIEPRKNLERMLDCLKLLLIDHPGLNLVLAGGRGWLYESFFTKISSSEISGSVILLDWVPDKDLPAIICGAELAVQPSLFEGFGLPVLEHMACGQVVAASQVSSLPEVGGEAAAYFNPLDVEDMAAVISRLLKDEVEWTQRRDAGLKQAGKFSWSKTAQETVNIYRQLIQGK